MNAPNYPDTMTETSSRDPLPYWQMMLILALWAVLGVWQSWSAWQMFLLMGGGVMATGLAVIGANILLEKRRRYFVASDTPRATAQVPVAARSRRPPPRPTRSPRGPTPRSGRKSGCDGKQPKTA